MQFEGAQRPSIACVAVSWSSKDGASACMGGIIGTSVDYSEQRLVNHGGILVSLRHRVPCCQCALSRITSAHVSVAWRRCQDGLPVLVSSLDAQKQQRVKPHSP